MASPGLGMEGDAAGSVGAIPLAQGHPQANVEEKNTFAFFRPRFSGFKIISRLKFVPNCGDPVGRPGLAPDRTSALNEEEQGKGDSEERAGQCPRWRQYRRRGATSTQSGSCRFRTSATSRRTSAGTGAERRSLRACSAPSGVMRLASSHPQSPPMSSPSAALCARSRSALAIAPAPFLRACSCALVRGQCEASGAGGVPVQCKRTVVPCCVWFRCYFASV